MKCPRDHVELFPLTYEAEIEVDNCLSCGGIYLDQGELERIQETIERDYALELKQLPEFASVTEVLSQAFQQMAQKNAEPIHCPGCGHIMEIQEHPFCKEVILDFCTQCYGIWLDKGELQALEVYFERHQSVKDPFWKRFFSSLFKKKT